MIAAVALTLLAGWKYERVIDTSGAAKTVSVAIPPSIYANAQPSLDDLRVVDASGNLVPMVLRMPQPASPIEWKDANLTDAGFVAGKYSQVVADLGAGGDAYGILDLATSRQAFATTVDVDASDDRATWRTIRSAAPIYDYKRDGLATNTRVTFPTSTARYLRIRVLDRMAAFPIDGVRVAAHTTALPESTRYAIDVLPVQSGMEPRTSAYAVEGIDNVPINRFRVDSSTNRFVRAVDLQTSADGESWNTLVSLQISRTSPGRDALFLDFDEAQVPHWRLVIHNGDDAPLAGVRIEAFGTPRRIDFDDSPAGAPYRLVYGNPSAPAPRFDYAQTHDAAVLSGAADVALGAPSQNPDFVPAARPWTDRNPWLLWLALGVAIVGIGGLAIRTMTGTK